MRPSDLDRESYYASKLDDVEGDLDAAREDQNWAAVASLHRRATETRKQLDALRLEERPPDLDDLDPDQALALLQRVLRELPGHLVEDLIAAQAAAVPGLRLVHDQKADPADG